VLAASEVGYSQSGSLTARWQFSLETKCHFDLNKLREDKKQPKVIDPVEIFRRLPKKPEIKDLYGSQTDVLNAWFADRAKTDHVVKLHTGGGKMLVGLLMAQSIINETGEPVVFTVVYVECADALA
jgi:superfamily II DNA or RNA helicase